LRRNGTASEKSRNLHEKKVKEKKNESGMKLEREKGKGQEHLFLGEGGCRAILWINPQKTRGGGKKGVRKRKVGQRKRKLQRGREVCRGFKELGRGRAKNESNQGDFRAVEGPIYL